MNFGELRSSVRPVAEAIAASLAMPGSGLLRVEALITMVGVEPNIDLKVEILSIHLALGTASPGTAELLRWVNDARAALGRGANPVHRQHIISKKVLANFASLPSGGSARRRGDVQPFDVGLGRRGKKKGPGGIAYIENFIKVDSHRIEELWQTVENGMHRACAVAGTGEAIGDSETMETLRKAVFLHLVRNPAHFESHKLAWEKVVADAEAATRPSVLLGSHGLPLAGAARRGGRLDGLQEKGALFRLSVERDFWKWSERLALAPIEFVRPKAESEFLIGDVPVLGYRQLDGAAAPVTAIGLRNCDSLIFPIGKDLMLRLHLVDRGKSRIAIADAEQVERFNQHQVVNARRFVYYRPDAGFEERIASWRGDAGRPEREAR